MGFLRFFVFVLSFFCALVTFSAAQALDVADLRFGVHEDKVRLVLDLDKDTEFRAFTLSDPYRLVIDLPQFEWQAGNVPTRPQASVKALRHGNLNAGVSRIVLDMNQPVVIDKAFTLSGPNRLVIDYKGASSAEFERVSKTVFGTLDADRMAGSPPVKVRTAEGRKDNQVVPGSKPQREFNDTPSRADVYKKPLVVIDPGHGGVDPGAIGSGNRFEKDAVLALAKELREELLSTGRFRVAMTREKDVFIKLQDRVKIAHDYQADLFISIHADSIDKHDVRGASFYTLSNKASDAQTAKLAAKENRADLIAGIDLSHEDEDVANILVDLAMRDTMNQSRFFAGKLVQSYEGNGLRMLPKPHRYAGFAVLKAPDIPSVLVEAGFMSNKQEAALLNTPEYRKKVAATLRKGVEAYFDHVEEAAHKS